MVRKLCLRALIAISKAIAWCLGRRRPKLKPKFAVEERIIVYYLTDFKEGGSRFWISVVRCIDGSWLILKTHQTYANITSNSIAMQHDILGGPMTPVLRADAEDLLLAALTDSKCRIFVCGLSLLSKPTQEKIVSEMIAADLLESNYCNRIKVWHPAMITERRGLGHIDGLAKLV